MNFSWEWAEIFWFYKIGDNGLLAADKVISTKSCKNILDFKTSKEVYKIPE